MKRWREVTAKPGHLLVKYGKAEGEGPDVCFAWGDRCSRRDSNLMYLHLAPLLSELKARRYDITTVRFSIAKRADRGGEIHGN